MASASNPLDESPQIPCAASRSYFLRTHALTRSVPVTHDSTNATLSWHSLPRGVFRKPASVISTLSTAQPAVALRFVLCGSAKLFAFSVWAGAPPEDEKQPTPSATSDDDATAEATRNANPHPQLAKPQEVQHAPFYELAGRQQRAWRERWELRRAEMARNSIAYGRCSLDTPEPVPIVEKKAFGMMSWRSHGPCMLSSRLCAYPLSTLPDPQRASGNALTDGVQYCREICEVKCPQCGFASLSWNEYK